MNTKELMNAAGIPFLVENTEHSLTNLRQWRNRNAIPAPHLHSISEALERHPDDELRALAGKNLLRIAAGLEPILS